MKVSASVGRDNKVNLVCQALVFKRRVSSGSERSGKFGIMCSAGKALKALRCHVLYTYCQSGSFMVSLMRVRHEDTDVA